jgi:hypothetical protein
MLCLALAIASVESDWLLVQQAQVVVLEQEPIDGGTENIVSTYRGLLLGYREIPQHLRIISYRKHQISVADPGSNAFLPSGSGMNFFPDLRSKGYVFW